LISNEVIKYMVFKLFSSPFNAFYKRAVDFIIVLLFEIIIQVCDIGKILN